MGELLDWEGMDVREEFGPISEWGIYLEPGEVESLTGMVKGLRQRRGFLYEKIPLDRRVGRTALRSTRKFVTHGMQVSLSHAIGGMEDGGLIDKERGRVQRTEAGDFYYNWSNQLWDSVGTQPDKGIGVHRTLNWMFKIDPLTTYSLLPADSMKAVAENLDYSYSTVRYHIMGMEGMGVLERGTEVRQRPENEWVFFEIDSADKRIGELLEQEACEQHDANEYASADRDYSGKSASSSDYRLHRQADFSED